MAFDMLLCAVSTLLCICPADSDHSQQGGSDHEGHKHAAGNSRDSGMAAADDKQRQPALMREPDPLQLLQECSNPLLAASMYAAHQAKQQAMQEVHTAGEALCHMKPTVIIRCSACTGLPQVVCIMCLSPVLRAV